MKNVFRKPNIFILFIILNVFACTKKPELNLTANEVNFLKKRKIIVLVGDEKFPPFDFINRGGAPDGFDVDVARKIDELLKDLGVKVDVKLMSWGDAISSVKNKLFDGFTGFSRLSYREKDFDFGIPVLKRKFVVVVLKENEKITDIDDLKKFKIGAQAEIRLRKFFLKNKNVIYDSEIERLLKNLIKGKFKAVVIDRHILLNIMKENPLIKQKVKILKIDVLPAVPYGIAVWKGNDEVLNVLDKSIRFLQKNGTIEMLKEKWFGIKPVMKSQKQKNFQKRLDNEKFRITYVYPVLGLILLIILAILILKQKKLRKTKDFSLDLFVFENSPNPVVITDDKGIIKKANSSFYDHINKRDVSILWSFFDHTVQEKFLTGKFKQGAIKTVFFPDPQKHDKGVHVLVNLNEISNKNIRYYQWIIAILQ